MDKHASSSSSHRTTPVYANSFSKGPSSISAESALKAWVKHNEETLLEAFANWTRADEDICKCPGGVTCYDAFEGTKNDMYYNLRLIYEKYGPLDMSYQGCDSLAYHWAYGWDPTIKSQSVQTTMMCVKQRERLPGQSPVLDRLNKPDSDRDPKETDQIEAYSDEEDDEENDEGDDQDIAYSDEGENGAIFHDSAALDLEKAKQEDEDGADWVDVSSGGVDDGEWMDVNSIPSIIKDAGRLLLDGCRKL